MSRKKLIISLVAFAAGYVAYRAYEKRAAAARAGAFAIKNPLLDPYSDAAVPDCSGRIGVVDNVTGAITWKEVWQEGCD